MRALLSLLLLIGCSGKAVDSSGTLTFSKRSELQNGDFGNCEVDAYWPAPVLPLIVDRLIPPEPPYQITRISAVLYQQTEAFPGRDCSTTEVPLHVVVWLADKPKLDAAIDTEKLTLEVEPLAEAFVTAGPAVDGGFAIGTVELDPPVLVTEPGKLWIGMDTEGDPGRGPGACLGGCPSSGNGIWRAVAPDWEWTHEQMDLPLYRLTVEHN